MWFVPMALDPVPDEKNIYDIIMVADLDTDSRVGTKNLWKSFLTTAQLLRSEDGSYSVLVGHKKEVFTQIGENERGMELSELIKYNGVLYSFDDRTGIIYEIKEKSGEYIAVPKHIVTNPDPMSTKGFKFEWATVKDNKIYAGSLGKEWSSGGKVINFDLMNIFALDGNGKIDAINWMDNYNKLRRHTKTLFPGYMVHEAVCWNDYDRKWYFLPRRVSKYAYEETDELRRGSNIMLIADNNFARITSLTIGEIIPTRGFSSFKFIPGRPYEIVAIKSEETPTGSSSYIMVFRTDGTILMEETKIDDIKIEGIEFV